MTTHPHEDTTSSSPTSLVPCRRPGCPGVARPTVDRFCSGLCRGLDAVLHRVRKQLANEHLPPHRLQALLDREDALVAIGHLADTSQALTLTPGTRRYSRLSTGYSHEDPGPDDDPSPSHDHGGVGQGEEDYSAELGYSTGDDVSSSAEVEQREQTG